MVINRKLSVSTAPPVSRTASTQPAVHAPILGIPNGSKMERRRSKVTKPERKRFVSYSGILQVMLFVLLLPVYTTVFCRIGFARTSPLCKSLEFYRSQIIDPYVPPIASFAESSVAPFKPYAASTVEFTQTRIMPHISAIVGSSLFYYETKVSPRLRWLIVDQLWERVIKSSYFDILKRHIQTFYNNHLVSGVYKGTAYAKSAYIRCLPHAHRYLSNARKNAARIVRPHVVNLYVRLRPRVVVFLDQARMLALDLAQKAGELRREFIDPHVRKILDTTSSRGLETF